MRQTSLNAYRTILDTGLGKRQYQVLNAIKRLNEPTRKEVSEFTGLPINSVTPRVKELLIKGVIIECGVTSNVGTGMKAMRLKSI